MMTFFIKYLLLLSSNMYTTIIKIVQNQPIHTKFCFLLDKTGSTVCRRKKC